MQIAHFDVHFAQIGGQALGHLFGQRRDQHAIAFARGLDDLGVEIVHLSGGGANVDFGIEQAGRTDDLLDDLPRVFQLVGRGRRADADELTDALLKFLET